MIEGLLVLERGTLANIGGEWLLVKAHPSGPSAAHAAIQLMVSSLGAPPAALTHDDLGRPRLDPESGWSVSVSHTRGHTGVALAPVAQLGLDIEIPRPISYQVMRRCLGAHIQCLFSDPLRAISYGYGGTPLGTGDAYFRVTMNGAQSTTSPVWFKSTRAVTYAVIEGERLYLSLAYPGGNAVSPSTWGYYGPTGIRAAGSQISWGSGPSSSGWRRNNTV